MGKQKIVLVFLVIAVIGYFALNYIMFGTPIHIVDHKDVSNEQHIGKIVLLLFVVSIYTFLFIMGVDANPYYILFAFGIKCIWDGSCEKKGGCTRDIYIDSFLFGGYFLLMFVIGTVWF